MKFFLSYKFTGVDKSKLYDYINPIIKIINDSGNDVFCNLYCDNFYIKNKYSAKEIMEHCFGELKKCDCYIAFVDDIFGGGMAIECGYAYCLGLKIIACIPNNTENFTSLKGICDTLIYYDDMNELNDKLNIYLTN